MDNFEQRFDNLSLAKRKLLELRLKQLSLAGKKETTIPRRQTAGPGPLSFGQYRHWFLQQLEPNSPAYTKAEALHLKGPLDEKALSRALTTLVERHEILRTTYTSLDWEPLQWVNPARPVDLPLIDLSDLPPATQQKELQQQLEREVRQPFDLAKDLMLRYKLYRLGPEAHVLLRMTHRIASDKWSSGILNQELSALYASYRAGQPSPLPELPIQYADFALWQREWLRGELLEKQLAYWKDQLKDGPPLLALPYDHSRPAAQTYRGSRCAAFLPAALSQALKSLSQQHGVTLFMTMLAAFNVLLHRYSRQSDILVGAPVAGRPRTETERLIGLFINTLVMRTDLSGKPSFLKLLGRVRQMTLGAYSHQDLPFERLVEELQPERNLNRPSLFQVMFDFLNTPAQAFELAGLALTRLPLSTNSATYDLIMFVSEEAGGINLVLEYNTDLFEPDTIARMLAHFQRLLEAIITDPSRPIGRLPLLTEAERYRLLVEWNQTQIDYPLTCIHQAVEAQVERTPDAVAVVFEEQRLSYRELNARANQVARYLQRRGVGPNTPVGLCAERSPELVAGILGILKAGGVYLPLDPSYPRQRLAYMAEEAGASLILSQEKWRDLLPRQDCRIVCLDAGSTIMGQEDSANLVDSAMPGHPAYIIYTSGSTGKPNPVIVSHRALANHLLWRQATFPLTGADAFLQKASISFDISIWEIFAPLVAGARLVLARPEGEKDPTYLAQLIHDQAITDIHFGPAALQLFLDQPEVDRCATLKRLFCGGETLPAALQEQVFARLKVELYHQYGPTETTIDVTIWRCIPGQQESAIPIGRPIANTQAYILDPYLQPVPVGVPGELYIGGLCLAEGYLNRPQLTAQKFIPNPFYKNDASGMMKYESDDSSFTIHHSPFLYKTGDLARYLPDGNIQFLGRTDHQVKIRGFRIELEEIEAILRLHPAVRQSLVTVVEDQPDQKRLVAYIIPGQEPLPSLEDLHDFLKEKLPAYMIPSAFIVLEQFPLTVSGKIDRQALASARLEPLKLAQSFVDPAGPIEKALAEFWQQLLHVDRVGASDNFFYLGGHSLLVIQLVSKIRRYFQVDLPLRTLFEQPTIRGLAGAIEASKNNPVEQSTLIKRANREDYRSKMALR